MKIPTIRDRRSLATLLVLILVAPVPACQQDNEAEFLRNAPPGTASSVPGESVGQRRARLRVQSPLEKKLEAKKAAAEKKAARKAAAEGGPP